MDKNWQRTNIKLEEDFIAWLERLNKRQLDDLIVPPANASFTPFIKIEADSNGKLARDFRGQKPEIGDVTNNVRINYLTALVKDIILDLKTKDEEILTTMYNYHRKNQEKEILKIIKDRLRHSIKLQKKEQMTANSEFESDYFKENEDCFTAADKIYFLDRAVLAQLENRMYLSEIYDLWSWEITDQGTFMVLGSKSKAEEPFKYNLSNSLCW